MPLPTKAERFGVDRQCLVDASRASPICIFPREHAELILGGPKSFSIFSIGVDFVEDKLELVGDTVPARVSQPANPIRSKESAP